MGLPQAAPTPGARGPPDNPEKRGEKDKDGCGAVTWQTGLGLDTVMSCTIHPRVEGREMRAGVQKAKTCPKD